MAGDKGFLEISPQVAIDNATKMQETADALKDLLDRVKTSMAQINDKDAKLYQGGKSPTMLRDELDDFSSTFDRVYTQVSKSSADIKEVAVKNANI